ncbi:MAG: hypothetical protein AB7P04_10735 [Bacteriovoracia bacterium]
MKAIFVGFLLGSGALVSTYAADHMGPCDEQVKRVVSQQCMDGCRARYQADVADCDALSWIDPGYAACLEQAQARYTGCTAICQGKIKRCTVAPEG